MYSFVPGSYYLLSRYSTPFERVTYLIKYWVPFLIVGEPWICLRRDGILIGLSMIAFMAVYDTFCFMNDTYSERRETNPARRKVPFGTMNFMLLTRGAWFTVSISAYAMHSNSLYSVRYSLTYYGLCALVFYIHNMISAKARVMSYFLLYFLKGGVAYIPVISTTAVSRDSLRYIVFSFLYALSYVPQYAQRKFLIYKRICLNPWTWVFSQTVFYKNVFLFIGFLFSLDLRYLLALGFIDLMTLLELIGGRRVPITYGSSTDD